MACGLRLPRWPPLARWLSCSQTYSFGDHEALYLRGQWTMHRNVHHINTVWKGCPHLGLHLQKELLLKVAWVRRMESRGIQNNPKRFQSAEGCYSVRAVGTRGMRIRVANKQFVGLTIPADQRIYYVSGVSAARRRACLPATHS